MLPSFVSNLIWGSDEDNTRRNGPVESAEPSSHDIVLEECEDGWLVIDYSDNDSVNSEESKGSWIVEPSPRFLTPTSALVVHHQSMENLLLENPTMSVYSKQHQNDEENSKELQNKQLLPYDTSKMQLVPVNNNNNKQLVLYNNKAKLELADKMGIPLTSKETKPPEKVEETHPKTTKKSLKKHNTNMIKVVRGKKSFKIHQCGLKAGRRRN